MKCRVVWRFFFFSIFSPSPLVVAVLALLSVSGVLGILCCPVRCPGSVGCPDQPWAQGFQLACSSRVGAGLGLTPAELQGLRCVRVPDSLKEYLDRSCVHEEPGNSSETPNNWAERNGCSLKCLLVVKWLLYYE